MAPPAALQSLLAAADVCIDGDRPWDIRLHDPGVWGEVRWRGSLGFGEAYVRGAWDCSALDQLFTRLLQVGGERRLAQGRSPGLWLAGLAGRRSTRVARRHHDIHPEVYATMLDPRRLYSCGYWEQASSLEEAQEHKLRLICEKLQLAPGQRLLDIGCGWGGLAAFAAEHYGVEVVGITLSSQRLQYARSRWGHLPVRFELCDYRQLARLGEAPFHRLVSVGMFEHVGPGNARSFFRHAAQAMRDDGLFLLHTIGYRRCSLRTDRWIDSHVFPHGRLPAPRELAAALERDFLLQDWHNFGLDYARTLMAWHRNVEAAWPSLAGVVAAGEGMAAAERFRRYWRYYLLCFAGFFRSGQGQLWQLVLRRAERQPSVAFTRGSAAQRWETAPAGPPDAPPLLPPPLPTGTRNRRRPPPGPAGGPLPPGSGSARSTPAGCAVRS
jgi:cyclopropane-fatty-acyl-phospholipid synthase